MHCTSYLESVGFRGSVFYCIDNSQLVNCIDTKLAEAIHAPASSSIQGTWQRVVSDLIHSVTFNIGTRWLKSHVGFTGNELADAFAKYTVYACRVLPSHLHSPRMHTVTFDGQQSIQKFGGAARKRLYPEHDHTGIAKSVSFSWPNNYSRFSCLADKWSLGVKGMAGSSPFWDLSDRQCPVCTKQHPLDLVSSVAFCSRPVKNTAHGPLWAGGQQFDKRGFFFPFFGVFLWFS